MGTQSLLKDMEVDVKIRILEDSSAAKGIAERTGLGKVRHIEVNQLWIQEKVREGRIQLVKVEGTENLADALTKYVESDMLDKHIRGSECEVMEGRHELMPEVQSSEMGSKEEQDEEAGDQEEDQLGHLGCLSHEESDHNENYQHNNEQMKTKERECSSEESSSGLIDPREIDTTTTTATTISSDNEEDILTQCCNDLPCRGLKYRLNHKKTNTTPINKQQQLQPPQQFREKEFRY